MEHGPKSQGDTYPPRSDRIPTSSQDEGGVRFGRLSRSIEHNVDSRSSELPRSATRQPVNSGAVQDLDGDALLPVTRDLVTIRLPRVSSHEPQPDQTDRDEAGNAES